MPHYQVVKELHFAYGHRLLGHEGKCRSPHGHNARVEIVVSAEHLDSQGMVYDFAALKKLLATWIDENLDHRMILCRRDPLVKALTDLGEPVFLLDENPTAEILARRIFDEAHRLGLPVREVRFWETHASRASYAGAEPGNEKTPPR